MMRLLIILQISLLSPLSSLLFYVSKTEGDGGIDAEGDDQHGLDRVDDEHEIEGFYIGHAIENEHGLYGEMPRTGTVGGGYDDGYGAYDECHQRTAQSEMGREVEAEEGEIVVQEIAHPDGEGEEGEQGYVLDVLQRDDALPDAAKRRAYLIIYGEFAQQEVQQDEHGCGADGYHQIACPREAVEDVVQIGARLLEEGAKGAHLQQNDNSRDAQHQEGVDSTLCHNRAQRFGERYAVIARQHTTARKLTHTWYEQRGGIAEEDGVDAR